MRNFVSIVITLFIGISVSAQTSANLRLNLVKGKTYKAKVNTRQITTTMENRIQQEKGITYHYFVSLTPLSVDENSVTAKVRFDTIINTFSFPAMVLTSNYKGNSLNISDPSNILSTVLKRLSKADLIVKFDPTGNASEITNFTQVSKSILNGLDSIRSDAAVALKLQAKSLVSESTIKQMINTVTAFLPGTEIKVGTNWDATSTVVTNGIVVVDSMKLKFEKIDGTKAVITSESIIKPLGGDSVVRNGAKLQYDINGIGKSTVKFDLKTGWPLEVTSKQYSAGYLNLTVEGKVNRIPLEINKITEITSFP